MKTEMIFAHIQYRVQNLVQLPIVKHLKRKTRVSMKILLFTPTTKIPQQQMSEQQQQHLNTA